jgi:spermidine/putrescine transport system substrate-binding protein
MSRRDLLKAAGAGAGVISLGAFLAACGAGGGTDGGGSPSPQAAGLFEGEPSGTVVFGNWPLYIDKEKNAQGKVVNPSLDLFTKETGIKVDYKETIQGNESFFGKIQPQLSAGQDIGYDIIVITNGPTLRKLIALNYLVELPADKRPNFDEHAGDHVTDPPFDPGNKYTMAWQSGLTGIGWDPKQVAQLRPDKPTIDSLEDLFDPAFKGKVGMFADTSDMPNTGLIAIGADPETSTPEQWQTAADKLTKQRDDGIVRTYYEQNYVQALSNGDVAVCQAWSGDIFQLNLSGDSEGLQFTVPTEGGIIWTDNMCIPAGAAHPVDAITYMDYVYQPEVQAMIEEWVNYICPVPTAQEVVAADAAAASGGDAAYLENVASSPLVFPTPEEIERLHVYRTLDDQEEVEWNSLFQPIFQG